MDKGKLIGNIIGIFIGGIFFLGFLLTGLNIIEDGKIAKETKDAFCPEGRTYEGTFDVKSYCKGQEYTCSTEECYWITDKQETTKGDG